MQFSSILVRNWPQFAKIFLLTVIILVFSFGWVWFREIPNLQQDLVRERTHATQYPIQMVVSILDMYRARVHNGELSLQDAQERALRTLHETRYADNQYFWVHDLSLKMLMHPFNPGLVGKNLSDYRDSQGVYLFREINEKVRTTPDGTIKYTWPRPGSEIPEQKMSCFKLYEPWGWVIGSGIYLDDVNSDISSIKKRVLTSVFSAFLLTALFSLYVIYRINQPLRQTIEFARQIADGSPVDSIAVNPESEGGKVVAVIKGLLTDLQTAYNRQKSIIETTSDGFFIIATDGRFIEVNHSFCLMLGYDRHELLSLNLDDVEEHILENEVKEHIHEMVAKGADCFEKTYRRKDSTSLEVEVCSNYTDENNCSLICFVRDITEKKRLEEDRKLLEAQLIQSQKMEAIGKLAGGVAHEFNNILQIIGGYTMLMHEDSNNQEHRGYLSVIQASVGRASTLTQGMLTYSRQQVFALGRQDVNEVVRRVVPFLNQVVGESMHLENIYASEPIWGSIDSNHIQQAVINLVANARDAIKSGGTIRITTSELKTDRKFVQKYPDSRIGVFAVISVSDTGEGMDEATRTRVFDPFYTTREIGKGTGLGLSIVHGIMSQHNGFVTCDSTVGKGSTFSLYLPVDESEVPSVALSSAVNAEDGRRGATVLLAEDDAEVARIISKMLELKGYKVIRAADGVEAVAIFAAFRSSIDLLLFDVMMPNKNGKQALDEIRVVRPGVPVCFISGYASEALGLDITPGGINAFVTKPVDHKVLVNTIENLLERPASGG